MCAYTKLRYIFTLSIYILVSISIKQIWKDTGNSQHRIPLGTRMFRICDTQSGSLSEKDTVSLIIVFVCLGLCCMEFSLVAVHGLLIAVTSSVAEHGLQVRGLRSCGFQALAHRPSICGTLTQLLRGVWDLPKPGMEPMSPALASSFFTNKPPGKPQEGVIFLTLPTSTGQNIFCNNKHYFQGLFLGF